MCNASKPTIRDRAAEAVCPDCGGEVVRRSTRGPVPTFCTQACKISFTNRHVVEGRAVIALLKAWRIDRGTGEIAREAFAQVNQILDQFNAQDKDADRPRADLYAAKLLLDGTRFFDRQHAANAKRSRAKAAVS